MDEARTEDHQKEESEARVVPRRRSTANQRRRGPAVSLDYQSLTLDDIPQGVILQRITSRTKIRDVVNIGFDLSINRTARHMQKDKNGRSVAAMFQAPLWRGCLSNSRYWSYGDSREAAEAALLDHFKRTHDPNNNDHRWPEYELCRDLGHIAEVKPITSSNRKPTPDVCTKCGTEYYVLADDKIVEVNPPHDPDKPAAQTIKRYILLPDWEYQEEPHLVSWAVWFSHSDRTLKRTTLGDTTVLTQFRGYCEVDPPLLWETVIFVGQRAFPVGLHGHRLEAIVCHDHTVGELFDSSQLG